MNATLTPRQIARAATKIAEAQAQIKTAKDAANALRHVNLLLMPDAANTLRHANMLLMPEFEALQQAAKQMIQACEAAAETLGDRFYELTD